VESCGFDGVDCMGPDEECSEGCKAAMVNDGECQSACSVEECGFDGLDCLDREP